MISKIKSMSKVKAGETGPGQYKNKELSSNGNRGAQEQDKTDYNDEIHLAGLTDKDCLEYLEYPVNPGYLKRLEPAESVLFCCDVELSLEETEKWSMRDTLEPFVRFNVTCEEAPHGLRTGTRSDAWEGEKTRRFPMGMSASMYSQSASYDASDWQFWAKAGIRFPRRSGGELQIMLQEPATNTDEEYETGKIEETMERVRRRDLDYQFSQFTNVHWPRKAAKKPYSKARAAEFECLKAPKNTPPVPAAATRSSTFWEPRIPSQRHVPDETYLRGMSSPQADDYIAVSLHIAELCRLLRAASSPEIRVLLCARMRSYEPIFNILRLPSEDSKHPSNRIEILLSISRPWSLRFKDLEPIGDSGVVLPPLLHFRFGRKLLINDHYRQNDAISVVGGADEEAEIEFSSQPEATSSAGLFASCNWWQHYKVSGENGLTKTAPFLYFVCRQEPTVCGERSVVIPTRVSDIDGSRDLSTYLSGGISSAFRLINDYLPARLLAFFSLVQLSTASSHSPGTLGGILALSPVELTGITLTTFTFLSSAVFVDGRIERRTDEIKLGALLGLLAIFSLNVVDDASGGCQLVWIPVLLTLTGLLILSRALIRVRRGCSTCGEESCGGDCGSGSSTGGDDHV